MFFSNFGFDTREDEEYFGSRYGNGMYYNKKPKYYSDSPSFVGVNYKNMFKGYFTSEGRGMDSSGGTMFGGMTSVGGRTSSNDIPSGNVWSPSYNSTLGGSSSAGGYYCDYSKTPSTASLSSQYPSAYSSPSGTSSYGNSSYSSPGSVSKEV